MSGGADVHSIQQARKAVEQLKREKNMRRSQVSACSSDLIRLVLYYFPPKNKKISNFRYVQEYQKDDYLIAGFASDKMNPYRPKNNFQCLLL